MQACSGVASLGLLRSCFKKKRLSFGVKIITVQKNRHAAGK